MITIVPDTDTLHDAEPGLQVEQLAALLGSALDDAGAQWGCVLTPLSVAQQHALVVIDRTSGDTPAAASTPAAAKAATNNAARPDALLLAAFDRSRPVFANRVSHTTLAGLPAGYPPINAFALLPCRQTDTIVAIVCLLNPREAFASPMINRWHMQMCVTSSKAPRAEESAVRAPVSDSRSLYFQPQWNLATGDLYGLEVLTRWHGPDDSSSTRHCLQSLQREGKLAEVGEHIIDSAFKHWATWEAADLIAPDINLAINVAHEQLLVPEFVEQMTQVLKRHSIRAQRVVLEIHEDIWHDKASHAVLYALSRQGLKLALDGFGTGRSTLQLLAQLPVDQLKLGLEFIAQLDNREHTDDSSGESGENHAVEWTEERLGNRSSDSAWNLIFGIVELARSLVLPVVAQGVEKASIRDSLAAAGCTACQGYALAPPLPASEIPVLLDQVSTCDVEALASFVDLSDSQSSTSKRNTSGAFLHTPA